MKKYEKPLAGVIVFQIEEDISTEPRGIITSSDSGTEDNEFGG